MSAELTEHTHHTTMKRWSEEAWAAARTVYEKILEHPFVGALADGTLPADRFRRYIRQDALYLDGYARRLAHLASRLTRKEHTEAFLHFALDGIAVERALHAQFLGGERPAPDEISPTCLLYTSLLDAQTTAPVEVEAAAVLPCFVVYQRVGEAIHARLEARAEGGTANANKAMGADVANGSEDRPCEHHPYRAWIDTYADPAFAASTRQAVQICDELAAATDAATRRRMTDIFVRCTRMEWMFWDSAWTLENWKI